MPPCLDERSFTHSYHAATIVLASRPFSFYWKVSSESGYDFLKLDQISYTYDPAGRRMPEPSLVARDSSLECPCAVIGDSHLFFS